ncbi:MAG: hypothetical protein ACU0BS_12145 [Hasllibacter sp.]
MSVGLLVILDALVAVLFGGAALSAAAPGSRELRNALIGGGVAVMSVASLYGILPGLLAALPLLAGAFAGRRSQTALPARPLSTIALIAGILAAITAIVLVVGVLRAGPPA